MSKKFFETTLETSGAKFNLTIDVSPTDCLIMCNELFNNLSSDDQSTIINTYLQNNSQLPKPKGLGLAINSKLI